MICHAIRYISWPCRTPSPAIFVRVSINILKPAARNEVNLVTGESTFDSPVLPPGWETVTSKSTGKRLGKPLGLAPPSAHSEAVLLACGAADQPIRAAHALKTTSFSCF